MDTKQFENLPLEEIKKILLFAGRLLVESTATTLDDRFLDFLESMITDDDEDTSDMSIVGFLDTSIKQGSRSIMKLIRNIQI